MSVDSTAQGGVNDVVNVPQGTEETLVSLGPTTDAHFATGGYALQSFTFGLTGNVSAATKTGPDCDFGATAQN